MKHLIAFGFLSGLFVGAMISFVACWMELIKPPPGMKKTDIE